MKNATFIFGIVATFIVASAILSLPVMLLWDWLMPAIFGLKEITWFQAWGLMVLCAFLFKSYTPNKE